MKRLVVFTGWYPSPSDAFRAPFVSQQVRIMNEYLGQLSGDDWKIAVWHQAFPTDLVSRVFRGVKPTTDRWSDEGIPVWSCQSTVAWHRLPFDQSFLLYPDMKKIFRDITEEIGGSPDLVWCVTLSAALLWSKFSKYSQVRAPFFLQEHSVPLSMHLKTSSSRKEARLLPKIMKQVVVVAERQIKEFQDLSSRFKIDVVWNPVRSIFLQDNAPKSLKYQILFVGRYNRQKGVERLLKALGVLNTKGVKVKTGLVGFGSQENELKKMARDYDIDDFVEFLGARNPDEIGSLLDESECFVLPSYYENCPVALLEAQVKGTPSIVTENGASEKVLLPGNGVPVKDDGSGEQLAAAIQDFFASKERYNRDEIRNRARKEFDPEIFAEKMYAVMKPLIQ